ncbi:uncharacterized protein KZ484_003858 isoform 2-T2 [Pholidichthys leucotaenia]
MKRWPSRENEVSHEASSIRAILMKSLKSSRKPHLAITTFNQAPSLLSHAQLSDVSNHGLSLRPGFSCAGLHRSSCLLHLPALFWQDLVVFSSRTKLREALSSYITETFTHINTVRGFCEKSSRWMLAREEEITQVADIKKRADKIDLLFSHVIRSEKKGETMGEFIDDKWKQLTTDSRPAELEKELAEVLSNTLRGLKKFDLFLAAVEKLAVTSLHVFKENKVVQLPAEINLENVRAVITAARQNCPLLLEFKRDSRVFFFPKLQNVEVLKDQLDRYLQTTRKLLDEILEKSTVIVCLNMRLVVDLSVDLSEDDIEKMLDDIDQLNKISGARVQSHDKYCRFMIHNCTLTLPTQENHAECGCCHLCGVSPGVCCALTCSFIIVFTPDRLLHLVRHLTSPTHPQRPSPFILAFLGSSSGSLLSLAGLSSGE